MSSITDVVAVTQLILSRYILPICLILGIFGNICNICIFIQKKLRSKPCAIYFIAASFINLLIIIFGIIPTIVASYIIDPILYLSWACKLKLYGLHSLLMMSRSYIVLACIDQYIFCSSDIHVRLFSRRQIALKLIFIVPIIWILIPLHILIFVDVHIPYVRCGPSNVYSLIYSIYSFVFTSLPLILMVVFSLLTFYNIRRISRRILPIFNNRRSVDGIRFRRYDYQIMRMLICQVIVYLISTILHPTNTLYRSLTIVSKDSPVKSSSRQVIEDFITYLTWSFLIYLNSCSTFYINFCVSQVFRSRFYRLINYLLIWLRYDQEGQRLFVQNNRRISVGMRSLQRQQY
ncbi:unnamed protein product [Adineta steineri]|uniref:G-protein coupled receptors family 1 profile domain-containing protein n=1 Tax=Adineta steineri TaxID=433720 RepID=A0A814RVM5_9BILA|nr:unnamed protein product [Adineta steineri]